MSYDKHNCLDHNNHFAPTNDELIIVEYSNYINTYILSPEISKKLQQGYPLARSAGVIDKSKLKKQYHQRLKRKITQIRSRFYKSQVLQTDITDNVSRSYKVKMPGEDFTDNQLWKLTYNQSPENQVYRLDSKIPKLETMMEVELRAQRCVEQQYMSKQCPSPPSPQKSPNIKSAIPRKLPNRMELVYLPPPKKSIIRPDLPIDAQLNS